MNVFQLMRHEWRSAQRTGSELAFFLFWGWVWFAWIMLAVGFPVICYLVWVGV